MNKRTQAGKTVSEDLEKMQSFSIHKEQANWKLKFKASKRKIAVSAPSHLHSPCRGRWACVLRAAPHTCVSPPRAAVLIPLLGADLESQLLLQVIP